MQLSGSLPPPPFNIIAVEVYAIVACASQDEHGPMPHADQKVISQHPQGGSQA